MLLVRVTHRLVSPLMIARATPSLLLTQVRTLSKVIQSDKGRNRKSKSSKFLDEVVGRIADEGRNLTESNFLNQSEELFPKKRSVEAEFLDDFYVGSFKRRRKTVLEDTTPSRLFVEAPHPSEQFEAKKSLYEENSEFALDFLNSLLYKNPFKDMKTDPYDLNYPIDNQDGQMVEKGVSFTEHVMLDDLYKDFPKSGPIRNFIEMVVTGLSQNPYLTPEEKREHVAWFKKEVDTLSPAEMEKMDAFYGQLQEKKAKRWKARIDSIRRYKYK